MQRREGLTPDQEATILKDAGKAVQAARRRKNLSQRELGRLARVSKSALSGFERGEHYPYLGTCVRLGFILELGMGDIFHGLDTLLIGDTTYNQILTLLPGTPQEVQEAILHFLRVSRQLGPAVRPPLSHA